MWKEAIKECQYQHMGLIKDTLDADYHKKPVIMLYSIESE